MANSSNLKRNYRYTDGELALMGNKLTTALNRDLVELAIFEISNTSIDNLNGFIDDFQALPADAVLRNDLSFEVEERESAKKLIIKIIRSISLRAKSVFGTNSANYRSLNPGNLSKMTDNNLLAVARQVLDATLNNVVELAAEGITAGYISNFNSAIETFAAAIDLVVEKKNVRDAGLEAKIKKGNELYSLINKYCAYGKLIWSNVSPAKYNDYIIYPNQKGRKKDGIVQ